MPMVCKLAAQKLLVDRAPRAAGQVGSERVEGADCTARSELGQQGSSCLGRAAPRLTVRLHEAAAKHRGAELRIVFCHQRQLVGGVPQQDWCSLLEQRLTDRSCDIGKRHVVAERSDGRLGHPFVGHHHARATEWKRLSCLRKSGDQVP